MGKLDNTTFLTGDVFDKLEDIESGSVHTVVTSPPYWRLRDYDVEGQIGLEPSPQQYIDKMTAVFDKIRNVLHESGSVWLVIDDTYYGGGNAGYESEDSKQITNKGSVGSVSKKSGNDGYLKPKDMCMIPQRLAVSLQKQGWWVRNQVIWKKPDAFPESVTDRLTRSYEFIYLLTKNKNYYYDQEAIKVTGTSGERNKRDVWEVNSKGFSDAHFAVFPVELVEPCILAATSEKGVCSGCGSPYRKVVEEEESDWQERKENGEPIRHGLDGASKYGVGNFKNRSKIDEYWEKTCECDTNETDSATVLDPFSGAGTTGIAALKNDRKYIGIDLKEEYHEMAKERIKNHKNVPENHNFW